MDIDKNTFWFRQMAKEIFEGPLPVIPYVGRGEGGGVGKVYNPPAEHMEISLVTKGKIQDIAIGNLCVDALSNHLNIHNVHFGNYSATYKDVESWCLVIDVTRRSRFANMCKAPFFSTVPILRPALLVEVFTNLMFACNSIEKVSNSYFGGSALFDPSRPIDKKLERSLRVGAALYDFFRIILEEIRAEKESVQLPIAVEKAREFIALNFQNHDLRLEDIATSAMMSTNHLGVLFRKHLKTSPMRYLHTVRLAMARNLLCRTGLGVGEVGRRCGFVDPLHFSREYRRRFGFPPSETI